MNYKGHGSYSDFVAACNETMTAMSNGVVKMPVGGGDNATLKIVGEGTQAKLTLDLREAPVFSLNNILWKIEGVVGVVVEQSAVVRGNKLVIRVRSEE